jgi:Fibronectin type III domain
MMGWNLRTRQRVATAVTLMITACATTQIAAADTVPLPGGAAVGSIQANELLSTSCPAAGDCVSVGWYTDSSDNEQALLETESNGIWSAQQANLPGSPSTQNSAFADLNSVSCTSVGNCVAIGQYDDSSGEQQGLLETESHGNWSASELNLSQLPSVYSGNPAVELTSVACPAAGDCVAIGQYSDAADKQQGLIASENNGTWTIHEADLSALVPFINPEVNLLQVSCASVGNCAAGGEYLDSSGNQQALLETEVNGSWSAGNPDLSKLNVAGDPAAEIESVSCPAAGSCSAVGYYEDGTYTYQGLTVNQVGGIWQPATEVQLPADSSGETAGQGDLYLAALSCASAGDCTAVGTYDSTAANNVEGLELTENGDTWSPALETSLPAASASNPDVWLASISCMKARQCVAAGTYDGSDGNNQALVARLSGDTWTTGSVEQPTTYNRFNSNGASVSCTPGGYCAVGGYTLTGVNPVYDSSLLLATPAAVRDASATSISDGSAQVTWAAPSDPSALPITGYLVTANDLTQHGSGGQTVAVGPGSHATFTRLTPMDTYTFTVRAVSLLGTGLPATTASITLPPTERQIWGSLAELFEPAAPISWLWTQAHTHTYTCTYKPLESGKVTVEWYEVTGHGQQLVASGSAATTGATAVRIPVSLTAFGQAAVSAGHTLWLTATATFGSGSTNVTRTAALTLY